MYDLLSEKYGRAIRTDVVLTMSRTCGSPGNFPLNPDQRKISFDLVPKRNCRLNGDRVHLDMLPATNTARGIELNN